MDTREEALCKEARKIILDSAMDQLNKLEQENTKTNLKLKDQMILKARFKPKINTLSRCTPKCQKLAIKKL
jgi:hypothetical protein